MPALFRASCGVSKKKTWRICGLERVDAERGRRRAVRPLRQRELELDAVGPADELA